MYFFLLTSYSNYVAFNEALALLDPLKKKAVTKIRKGVTFWKQPLDNIMFKIIYFLVLPYCCQCPWERLLTMFFVVLFLPLALVDWGPLQDWKDAAFCDKSQWLEAVTIVTKRFILYVAEVLDSPLKRIDKLK